MNEDVYDFTDSVLEAILEQCEDMKSTKQLERSNA
jgi:hypothetical protein